MAIQLQSIRFNHQPASAASDALNCRVDGSQPAPDWIRGAAAPSPAVYALKPTRNQQLTIASTFSFPGALIPPPAPTLLVRAQPVSGTSSVLGSVAPTSVTIPLVAGANTLPTLFPLQSVQIKSAGVGKYVVSWQWQVQLTPGGPWQDFDRSDHTIYVTLDLPGAPWSQATDAAHQPLWPWTRVLDWACTWAQGVTGTSAATVAAKVARAIEKGIYDLGTRPGLAPTYDPNGGEFANQVLNIFYCSDFLQLVDGTLPAGSIPVMSCIDCAAAVVTFANAVGCGLTLKKVHNGSQDFDTNAVVPIGGNAASPEVRTFGFHDIAVRPGATTAKGHVYDACLKIDLEADPASGRHRKFKLANGLACGAFTRVPKKKYKYVHRLITPADVSSSMIDDQPIMSLDGIGPPPPPPAPAVVAAKDKFRIIIDSVAPPITDIHPFAARLAPIAIPGYSAYEQIPNPRRLLVPEGLVTASAEFWYVATPSSEARRQPGRDQRIQVSVGYADSSSRAREALAWLLVQSETRPTTLATSGGRLGDAAFQSSDKTVALVVYRNAVARVRSVGSRPAPVAEVLGRVALSFNEE